MKALIAAHERLNSVLWAQTAVEHDAAYIQAYRQARTKLDLARGDKSWTADLKRRGNYRRLPPPVILDINEAILDNTHEEAEAIKAGSRPGLWGHWVRQDRAAALPGALEFTRCASANRVTVFYVTNRDAAAEVATHRILERLGFPLLNGANSIYCRGEKPEWDSDKGSRREVIAQGHRILLLIGDDPGDFLSGALVSAEERRRLVAQHSSRWVSVGSFCPVRPMKVGNKHSVDTTTN